MGQRTEEQITTDIEGTRRDLSKDLDELHEKVSPSQIMERRKVAARSKMTRMRDRVMGSAHEAKHSMGQGASSAGGSVGGAATGAKDSMSSAAQTVGEKTEGNPLAAGLIAFGAGVLVSSLIPASEKESVAAQRLVEEAKTHGQPVMDEAKSAGQSMGENLKEHARQSAEEVKASAQGSVQNVKDEGQSSAQHVKDDVQNRT
jgi:gas vesicle protein